jgi:hypothetical protein
VITDDQQDVAGTKVVIPLRFPMDRGKFGLVWPCLRAFDGDAQFFQDCNKCIQVFFGLFDDLLWKRTLRYFLQ